MASSRVRRRMRQIMTGKQPAAPVQAEEAEIPVKEGKPARKKRSYKKKSSAKKSD